MKGSEQPFYEANITRRALQPTKSPRLQETQLAPQIPALENKVPPQPKIKLPDQTRSMAPSPLSSSPIPHLFPLPLPLQPLPHSHLRSSFLPLPPHLRLFRPLHVSSLPAAPISYSCHAHQRSSAQSWMPTLFARPLGEVGLLCRWPSTVTCFLCGCTLQSPEQPFKRTGSGPLSKPVVGCGHSATLKGLGTTGQCGLTDGASSGPEEGS